MNIKASENPSSWDTETLISSIQSRFEKIAACLPNKIAIRKQNRTITYQGLNKFANQIARLLLQHATADSSQPPIAILMPQGIEMIASALGVLKAGHPYIPLDPSVPASRTIKMLEDAQAKKIIVDPQFDDFDLSSLPHLEKIYLSEAAGYETGNLQSTNSAEDLAYILYTSGSTGKPKGVMQTHKHVLHNTMVHTESFNITSDDRQSLLYPCNVYGSVRDTFNALLNGASLHILSVRTEELAKLPEWIDAEEITIYCSVATIFRHLINWLDRDRTFPTVRIVKLGGEVVYQADIEKFKQYFPRSCKLSCGLASTETGAITQYFIDHDTASAGNTAHLGQPVPGKEILLLDEDGKVVAEGEIGEIAVRSPFISNGYWNAPELTREKYAIEGQDGNIVYRMGDLAQRLADGTLVHKGRKDFMIKIRGNRIEIPDVEQAILGTQMVKEVVAAARKDSNQQSVLVAYLEAFNANEQIDVLGLRARLLEKLPPHMVPSYFIQLQSIPLLPNGKKDRNALPSELKLDNATYATPADWQADQVLDQIAQICAKHLLNPQLSPDTNFFEAGADSLKLVQIYRDLIGKFNIDLTLIDLFRHPNISSLAGHTEGLLRQAARDSKPNGTAPLTASQLPRANSKAIAIVGISCRFPQSKDVHEFWEHLLAGNTLLSQVPSETLQKKSVPKTLIESGRYVATTGRLDHVEDFDAGFFNFTAKEAELLDPQLRILLECSVEAIEDAGEAIMGIGSCTGVFTAVGKGNYLINNILPNEELLEQIGERRALLFNDRTYAASTVAYKLDLRGPTANVDTACSSSLVAIHQAVRSLQAGDCQMALAGGVRVIVPHGVGYEHGEAGIESSDGAVRPFDEQASGTIFGSGAGMLLLKPLDQALEDRNHIYAVIEGSAVTNDGANRVGFTAPTVDGQAEAVRRAHADAGIQPHEIAFIEAHGTGTKLGDPIEITALNEAFSSTDRHYRCPIGSVKSTLGHLSTASGVAGVIKAALALQKKNLPATVNFNRQNPHAPFDKGPFFVNKASLPLPFGKSFAGVSSFGLGGTNAHLVLSTAPASSRESDDHGTKAARPHLVTLSALDENALADSAIRLAHRLEADSKIDMHDVSHTLFNGRTHHHLRAAFSGHSKKEIIWKLKDFKSDEAMAKAGKNGIAFVFPGQGVQHLGMMKDLYQAEPVFRTHLDICSDLLIPHLEHDIRNMIFNSHEQEHAASLLEQTRYAQPVLFSFEFSLAKLMESIGITADAYIGHSLGEYVAATLSGVFTLPDALAVIATRGKLMQATEAGVMYAIAAPLDSVRHVAQRHDISIAAVNSQNQTVISGAQAQVESAVKEMAAQGLRCKPIHRTHAFHSALMEPILAEFVQQLSKFTLSAPTTPIVSNVTGQWLGQEASDPAYWARHLRSAVLFKDGVETLQERSNVLIEVGPGQTLTSLIRGSGPESLRSVALCRHAKDDADDQLHLFSAIGELWAHGLNLDWQALYPNQPASKVALPSYPFQRKHYWVEALDRQNRAVQAAKELAAAPTAETANFQEPEPLDVYHWVKDAWTQLLGEADIDADSDFFALGGDSMVLVQLQRKINKHYGIKIELGTLYQLATLGELTLHLSSQPIRTCSIAQQ